MCTHLGWYLLHVQQRETWVDGLQEIECNLNTKFKSKLRGQGGGPGAPLVAPFELAALAHAVLSEFAKSVTPAAPLHEAHAAFV
jgi:hypothetical protein